MAMTAWSAKVETSSTCFSVNDRTSCRVTVNTPIGSPSPLRGTTRIVRRAADDLEHVGGRGLLLQRFTQVFRARLHLFEQPHVLDRDDSLVGEGLKQLDMMVGKRAGLCARDADLPDRHAIAHQGRK